MPYPATIWLNSRGVPPYTFSPHTTWSPVLSRVTSAEIAAMPLPNTCALVPPSSEARFASSASRVGFDTREYSHPLCLPISSCA